MSDVPLRFTRETWKPLSLFKNNWKTNSNAAQQYSPVKKWVVVVWVLALVKSPCHARRSISTCITWSELSILVRMWEQSFENVFHHKWFVELQCRAARGMLFRVSACNKDVLWYVHRKQRIYKRHYVTAQRVLYHKCAGSDLKMPCDFGCLYSWNTERYLAYYTEYLPVLLKYYDVYTSRRGFIHDLAWKCC